MKCLRNVVESSFSYLMEMIGETTTESTEELEGRWEKEMMFAGKIPWNSDRWLQLQLDANTESGVEMNVGGGDVMRMLKAQVYANGKQLDEPLCSGELKTMVGELESEGGLGNVEIKDEMPMTNDKGDGQMEDERGGAIEATDDASTEIEGRIAEIKGQMAEMTMIEIAMVILERTQDWGRKEGRAVGQADTNLEGRGDPRSKAEEQPQASEGEGSIWRGKWGKVRET